MKTREEFKTTDEEGKELDLAVLYPSAKVTNEASLVYSSSWSLASRPARDKDGKLIRTSAPLRVEIEKNILPEHDGVWNPELEKELKDIQLNLLRDERKLAAGANEFNNLDEAVKVAFDMRKQRLEANRLHFRKASLDDNSAESFAEMARLNYLIYASTVYSNNNNPYYSSLDNYYNRTNEKASGDAASAMLRLLNNTTADFVNKTPEQTFLHQYGYLDAKFRRINPQGHLIDEDGKLINDKNEWVDSQENRVDIEGNLIDAKGDYVVEFKAFTDSEGIPILPKT